MSPFFKRRVHEVKSLVIRLLASGCQEGHRVDSRIMRAVVGVVIPIADRRPQIGQAFTATTKDFSNTGVAMVIKQPHAPDQAILGFHLSGKMVFFRAEVRHTEPMGGGFYQHGFQLFEVVSLEDYPELESLSL
jgi:hypothetical protein